MRRSHRLAGFTLVELLVVITIIGLLAALIVPAIQSAVEKGRQTACSNNLREIGLAAFNTASSKGYFPGYLNKLGSNNVSWQVAILGNMGRETLYKDWVAGTTTNTPYLEMYVCPSDNTSVGQTGPFTSFVVNTGQTGNKTDGSDTWEGVFHDLSDTANAKVRRVAIDGFPDGADVTLLASENLDADKYNSTTEPLLGFQFGAATPYINKSGGTGRPSSNHTGVVNVVFAGRNTKSIDETIDHEIWNQLMTPNGKKAGTTKLLEENSY